jgi:hypothetical protein
MQLNKAALGLAFGILWGVCLFLATIWVMMRGGGEHLVLLTKFYLGYSISFVGAILGLIWGFVEGFIGGWLLAWLYNRFAAGKSE